MFKFHRRIKYLFPEAKELYVVFRPRINFGNKLQGPLRHISKMEISKKKSPCNKTTTGKGYHYERTSFLVSDLCSELGFLLFQPEVGQFLSLLLKEEPTADTKVRLLIARTG